MAGKPLTGIRIIDCSQIWAGPFATKLMGDMGAEVIKVESARRFDNTRNYAGLPSGEPGERPYNRRALFNIRNRSKLGITLDLTTAKGVEVFKRLVATADVVVENFSTRVMPGLGLDYWSLKKVKPDIIMISLPAFGGTGPEKDYVGQGSNLTPLSGLVSVTGYPDRGPHGIGSYTDPVGGLSGVGAILAALHYHRKTGNGQYIDLAQQEASIRFIGDAVMDYTMNGRVRGPRGNQHTSMSPHGCYPCKGDDMWVAIAVGSDEEWGDFCEIARHLEWSTDPRFCDSISRYNNQDELYPLIAEWTRDKDHYEVANLLQAAGIAAGPVLQIWELLEDPHMKERGAISTVTHPEAGTFPMLGAFWKLGKTPGSISRPAPCLGEHNSYVYGEILGMSEHEIEELASEGVIGTVPAGYGS